MNILGKKIYWTDFIPPIVLKTLRYFDVYIEREGMKEPYVASCLHSYAQYHEDLILQSIFSGLKGGFYVDVGANHPEILSNTKKFYDQGWQGINIEPNPLLMEKFELDRPNDINLNIGISDQSGEMEFYRMSADTLSTFSKQSAIDAEKTYKESIVDVIQVKVEPLSRILQEYSPVNGIDFMTVDVEGFDLTVLKSNDWELFRPRILIIEINQDEEAILHFIESVGYEIAYKNHTNALFMDKLFSEKLISE